MNSQNQCGSTISDDVLADDVRGDGSISEVGDDIGNVSGTTGKATRDHGRFGANGFVELETLFEEWSSTWLEA